MFRIHFVFSDGTDQWDDGFNTYEGAWEAAHYYQGCEGFDHVDVVDGDGKVLDTILGESFWDTTCKRLLEEVD